MAGNIVQPEGNYYDKYESKNPIVKRLMKGFFDALDEMIAVSGLDKMGGYCLEAGCGEGNVTQHLYKWICKRQAKVRIKAFDISDMLIKRNATKIKNIEYFSHNIYTEIEEDRLPENGRFDLILCSEVLEHLERPEEAVKNLMTYGDRFIFSVPNEPIWRILNMVRGRYLRSFGNTPGHIQHFSMKSFKRMLMDSGFVVIKSSTPLPWLMVYCEKNKNAKK